MEERSRDALDKVKMPGQALVEHAHVREAPRHVGRGGAAQASTNTRTKQRRGG